MLPCCLQSPSPPGVIPLLVGLGLFLGDLLLTRYRYNLERANQQKDDERSDGFSLPEFSVVRFLRCKAVDSAMQPTLAWSLHVVGASGAGPRVLPTMHRHSVVASALLQVCLASLQVSSLLRANPGHIQHATTNHCSMHALYLVSLETQCGLLPAPFPPLVALLWPSARR